MNDHRWMEDHPVSELITDTLSDVAAALASGDLSAESREAFARVDLVLRLVEARLSSSDEFVVPSSSLEKLTQYLDKIRGELETFVSDHAPNRLQIISNNVDAALVVAAQIPIPTATEEIDSIREAVGTLRRSAGQHLRYFEEEAQDLQKRTEVLGATLDELRESLASQKQRVDAAIAQAQTQTSDLQKQFSESEQARRAEFSRTQEQLRDQFQQQLDQAAGEVDRLTTEITELEKRRREQLTDELANAKNEVADRLAKLELRVGDWEGELENRADALVDKIRTHLDEAQKLIHVIGNTGMVGGYQRVADQEKRRATFWQGVAAMAMVGIIGFAIWALVPLLAPDATSGVTWPALATRAFISLTFAILAGYGARQAGHHQERERFNRRMELQLASLDPYLVLLPADQQIEIKKALAQEIFGRVPDRNDVATGADAKDLVSLIRDAIKVLGH